MNLANLPTQTLLFLRKSAELSRNWSLAKRITDELAARGKAAESRRAS